MSVLQNPNLPAVASGTINPSVFVTQSGDFNVAQSASGDGPIGVAQAGTKLFNVTYAAQAGDPIGVYGDGSECYIMLGGTVTAGNFLKPDGSGGGTAIAGTSTDKIGAVALEGGASGNLIRCKVLVDNKNS